MKTIGRPKALLVLTDEERKELVGLRVVLSTAPPRLWASSKAPGDEPARLMTNNPESEV